MMQRCWYTKRACMSAIDTDKRLTLSVWVDHGAVLEGTETCAVVGPRMSSASPPTPEMRTGREKLLEAARDLFAERGFDCTTPRDIYERSGSGQSSFYHFFKSKAQLGYTIVSALVDEECSRLDDMRSAIPDPLARIDAFLQLPRKGTRGCRLGRYVYESPTTMETFRSPIKRYFTHVYTFLLDAVEAAQQRDMLASTVDAPALASMLLAAVQGGYVVARVHANDDPLKESLRSARTIVEAFAPQAREHRHDDT